MEDCSHHQQRTKPNHNQKQKIFAHRRIAVMEENKTAAIDNEEERAQAQEQETTSTPPSRPSQPEERHCTTTRYYPATSKDHGREFKVHNYCEHENVGMDTFTHTSRYVPSGQRKWMSHLFQK